MTVVDEKHLPSEQGHGYDNENTRIREGHMAQTELAKGLARMRESLGLDQGELAKLAGLSENYVWKLENDRIKNPGIYSILAIIEALAIPKGTAFEEMGILPTDTGKRTASLMDCLLKDQVLSPSYKRLVAEHYKEMLAAGVHLKEPPHSAAG